MINFLQQAFNAKTTGSALAPLIGVLTITSALPLGLFWLQAGWPAYAALLLPVLVLGYLLRVYDHLLKNDPNRLHSEAHIQQMKTLDLMGDNLSGQGRLTGPAISNPYVEEIDERR